MSFYERHRLPLRFLFWLLARPRVEGVRHLPACGGVVVVSNHLTMLDPLLLGVTFRRELRFMAKEELFRSAPVGWWLRRTGAFPVRRGEADRQALKQAEDLLRAGEVVMVFPEGHRSDTAQAQAAQAGAVLLAARTGAPILPVAIAGTEALRLRLSLRTLLRLLNRPRVVVRVGEPLQLNGHLRGGRRKAATEQVMRRIVAMLPPAYHGVYATPSGLLVAEEAPPVDHDHDKGDGH